MLAAKARCVPCRGYVPHQALYLAAGEPPAERAQHATTPTAPNTDTPMRGRKGSVPVPNTKGCTSSPNNHTTPAPAT